MIFFYFRWLPRWCCCIPKSSVTPQECPGELGKQVYWVRIRARMRWSPGWAVPAGRRSSEGLQRQWSSSFLRKEMLESLDQFSMSLGALGVYFSKTYSFEKTVEDDKWSKSTQMVNPWLSSTAAKKWAQFWSAYLLRWAQEYKSGKMLGTEWRKSLGSQRNWSFRRRGGRWLALYHIPGGFL